MTQSPTPETLRLQRRAAYDFNVAQAALARRAQADYGRWCLSALIVVHGSSLALGAIDGGASRWAPIAGLTLALLAGLMAWANSALSAIVHTHWADDRLLDPDDSHDVVPPRGKKRAADLAYLLAMALAAAAVALTPVALWDLAA